MKYFLTKEKKSDERLIQQRTAKEEARKVPELTKWLFDLQLVVKENDPVIKRNGDKFNFYDKEMLDDAKITTFLMNLEECTDNFIVPIYDENYKIIGEMKAGLSLEAMRLLINLQKDHSTKLKQTKSNKIKNILEMMDFSFTIIFCNKLKIADQIQANLENLSKTNGLNDSELEEISLIKGKLVYLRSLL